MVTPLERQAAEMFPRDYSSWRHCIEVECGIPLSPDYVAKRIAILGDSTHKETVRFAKLYGDDWHQQVLAWFQRSVYRILTGASRSRDDSPGAIEWRHTQRGQPARRARPAFGLLLNRRTCHPGTPKPGRDGHRALHDRGHPSSRHISFTLF